MTAVAACVLLIVLCFVFRTRNPGRAFPGTRLKLPTGSVVPRISIGEWHGLIIAGNGSLWSWGESTPAAPAVAPVLGLGKATNQPYLHRIGSDTNWLSVSAGMFNNLALKSDGTMWAWGDNTVGLFGNGARAVPPSANVPVAAAPGNDWRQIAVGGHHCIALKKDGTLWAWGMNWAGQLGIAPTNNAFVPMQIGASSNWTKIRARNANNAALQSDGSIWVWGNAGVLGVTNDNRLLEPVRLFADNQWVDAELGYGVVMAIKSDGTLWAWGPFAYRYTGVTNEASKAIPTRVGKSADWRSFNGNSGFRFLLAKRDNSPWTLDPVTIGPGSARIVPLKPILPDRDYVSFGVGSKITLAITREGEVWTLGRVLGETAPARPYLQSVAKAVRWLGPKVYWGDEQPVIRETPWLLPNLDSDTAEK